MSIQYVHNVFIGQNFSQGGTGQAENGAAGTVLLKNIGDGQSKGNRTLYIYNQGGKGVNITAKIFKFLLLILIHLVQHFSSCGPGTTG